MFVITYKFKIGDLVEVIDDRNFCVPILNKICQIVNLTKNLTTGKPTYCVSCEYTTSLWFVEEDQIIPAHIKREYQRITDPNVNYEELFKEPVYIEFINIGEALSKLQMFENKEAGNVYGHCVELKESPDISEIN